MFIYFFYFFQGCIRPSVVQHGSTNLTDTNRSLFPVGTVLQYSCDPGYLLVGRSILTCTSVGDWSSNLPRCIRNDGKHVPPFWIYSLLMIVKFINPEVFTASRFWRWAIMTLLFSIFIADCFFVGFVMDSLPTSISARKWRLHLPPIPMQTIFSRHRRGVFLWWRVHSERRLQIQNLSIWEMGQHIASQLCY